MNVSNFLTACANRSVFAPTFTPSGKIMQQCFVAEMG